MKHRYLICLILITFVPTLSAMAQSTGAETNTVPIRVPNHYKFDAAEQPTLGGGTDVYVRLNDTDDPAFHKHILSVLSDVHGMARMQRAVVIAARMQAAMEADPNFLQGLRVVRVKNGGVAVASKTGKFLLTADPSSVRTANKISAQKYAAAMIEHIQERLAGIKLR